MILSGNHFCQLARGVALSKANKISSLTISLPALVAELDACPTGDQAVAGSTPAGSATILR